jgi:hypothetical protein
LARDYEEDLLQKCKCAARNINTNVSNILEANVFYFASTLLSSPFQAEAGNLEKASNDYFEHHPSERLPAADLIKNGWVISAPRFHDMLTRTLKNPS